jgi:prephenate dehydratase
LQDEFNKDSILAKIETPGNILFWMLHSKSMLTMQKTKSLLEIMAEYFKVLGSIKNTKPYFEGIQGKR